MKAIIKEQVSNARRPDNKELVDTINVVAKCRDYDGKTSLRAIVTARFYMGRSASASVVYCCLWVRGRTKAGEVYTSGAGTAGGYGYHKESAALATAIRSAEIELFGDQYQADDSRKRNKEPARIDGCGSSAMDGALLAIAKAAGAIGQCLILRN